jgi:hypothetical protein
MYAILREIELSPSKNYFFKCQTRSSSLATRERERARGRSRIDQPVVMYVSTNQSSWLGGRSFSRGSVILRCDCMAIGRCRG